MSGRASAERRFIPEFSGPGKADGPGRRQAVSWTAHVPTARQPDDPGEAPWLAEPARRPLAAGPLRPHRPEARPGHSGRDRGPRPRAAGAAPPLPTPAPGRGHRGDDPPGPGP